MWCHNLEVFPPKEGKTTCYHNLEVVPPKDGKTSGVIT